MNRLRIMWDVNYWKGPYIIIAVKLIDLIFMRKFFVGMGTQIGRILTNGAEIKQYILYRKMNIEQ